MNYRWPNPHMWLFEKYDLPTGVIELLKRLDGDAIQDEFQSEMDADGYFEPSTESQRSALHAELDKHPFHEAGCAFLKGGDCDCAIFKLNNQLVELEGDDVFQCERCGQLFDVDDSVVEGATWHCTDCAEKLLTK